MTFGTSLRFVSRTSSRGCHCRSLLWRTVILPGFRSALGGLSLFSVTAQPSHETESDGNPSARLPSLSARMSFVFEQMDMIERERAGKDEAFRQIKAWRERKKSEAAAEAEVPAPALAETVEAGDIECLKRVMGEEAAGRKVVGGGLAVEVVHPWPEWIELMERLLQQNYFNYRRKSEDQMLENVGVDALGYRALENVAVDSLGFTDEGFDFTRDWMTVRTACLNFGRDRFDILRSLSRKDIQILVGHGCPSKDNKVVFSAKLLRKHVHLDEGDVCSSCSLRSSCERAYLLTLKEDEARTLDVMRVLLTYGFDPISGSVENRLIIKMKPVKTVIRKLLHEIVKLSAIPIDPNLPPPVIKKPPPKVKQPPPPPKKRVGRDDIEMKKGDWLCPKCDFMNFAKNTVCLQCDARRPKRQLLPGEWECPKCNFLNYRRNMACFHCDHKRPPDEFIENKLQEKPPSSRTRLERVANMQSVTNAWNFDFDDNESDGADVAAFEYADPPRRDDEASFSGCASPEPVSVFEDDPFEATQMQRRYQRGQSKDGGREEPASLGAGRGFDDFDDEEDDVDSYELDISSGKSKMDVSPSGTSCMVDSSNSDDFSEADSFSRGKQDTNSGSFERPSYQMRRTTYNNSMEMEEFNSDDDFSDNSDWPSDASMVSRQRAGGRRHDGSFRGTAYDSEDEIMFNSDEDDEVGKDLRHKQKKVANSSPSRKNLRRGRSFSDTEDEFSFGSDSDGEGTERSRRRSKENKVGRGMKQRSFLNLNGYVGSPRSGTRERRTDLRNSFGIRDHGDSFRRSPYHGREVRERRFVNRDNGGDYGGRLSTRTSWDNTHGQRMNSRNGSIRNFDTKNNFYKKQGNFKNFDNDFSQQSDFTGRRNNRRRNER